jgi:uncharacterized protein YbbC (DUF1343 family)
MPKVRNGLDVLVAQEFAPIRGLRVGLVTHPAAVDSQLRHAIELFSTAPQIKLGAIFGPEHGLLGQAQDLIGVSAGESKKADVPVYSLYGETVESLRPTAEQLRGLDALVIDLQDIGSRYYTFQATMRYCLQVALPLNMLVVVLDRPNPIGDAVEGPALQKGFESFVGAHDLATRHGLTIGELAMLYPARARSRPRRTPRRHVRRPEACAVLRRDRPALGAPLAEHADARHRHRLSRPVSHRGHEPQRRARHDATLRDLRRPLARLRQARPADERRETPRRPLRPVWFRPTFQKHAGKDCGGVQLHVTDRAAFQSVRTSLALLAAMREMSGANFAWRTEVYEFVRDPIAIDLLFGSARERKLLEAGRSWREVLPSGSAKKLPSRIAVTRRFCTTRLR